MSDVFLLQLRCCCSPSRRGGWSSTASWMRRWRSCTSCTRTACCRRGRRPTQPRRASFARRFGAVCPTQRIFAIRPGRSPGGPKCLSNVERSTAPNDVLRLDDRVHRRHGKDLHCLLSIASIHMQLVAFVAAGLQCKGKDLHCRWSRNSWSCGAPSRRRRRPLASAPTSRGAPAKHSFGACAATTRHAL